MLAQLVSLTLLAGVCGRPQGSYPRLTQEEILLKYPVIPHEYIVAFKAGHAQIQSHLLAVKADPDATILKEWHIKNDDVAKSFRGYHLSIQNSKIDALKATFGEEVAFVESNGQVWPDGESSLRRSPATECSMQPGATWGITRTSTVHNDKNSFYSYESGCHAWPREAQCNVNVYVIDTGIRTTHSEFQGRAVFGADMWHETPMKTDLRGHGTHVAGTIGGRLYGVAKDVNLISVNIFPTSGSGTKAVTISGIEWAVNDAKSTGKRSLINMSVGGSKDEVQNAAVDAASAAGVPCIISSGNDNADSCLKSPASAATAITVDSTTSDDARSSFSNFGACSDIAAPGSAITAAWINADTAINTISGTSMACPHVAGIAARLVGGAHYTASELKAKLMSMATPGIVQEYPSAEDQRGLLHMDCMETRNAHVHPAALA